MASLVRLYVDHPLAAGQPVELTRDQAHYLFGVMRKGPGDTLLVFNGSDGEWSADVSEAGKRRGILMPQTQTALQGVPPDLWLVFAPVKKARTDFIVEKAVELGVSRICPVMTDYTNSERVRTERMQAQAVEAAEQCGVTWVPSVAPARKLSALLDGWDINRNIWFCDEAARGSSTLMGGLANGETGHQARRAPAPGAIFVGPEGGFSDAERSRLNAMACTTSLSLGPRILRAETAAVAALTLWQSQLGDWT